MRRRVFYPHGPLDVISGFLSAVLAIGLAYLLFAYIFSGYASITLIFDIFKFGGWKVAPFLCAGLAKMLYRERIEIDPCEEVVTVHRSWFLVPIQRGRFPFEGITSVGWRSGSPWRLVMEIAGLEVTLSRQDHPDSAVEREVRRLVGLSE